MHIDPSRPWTRAGQEAGTVKGREMLVLIQRSFKMFLEVKREKNVRIKFKYAFLTIGQRLHP
jgi:hypothetical protein